MQCIICSGTMKFFFTKTFWEYEIGDADYWKCSKCGFCASKTHFDMSKDEWHALNNAFHSDSWRREDNPHNRNQRYFNQALMLKLMSRGGLIENGEWLDWGSGRGSVARLLKEYFDLRLLSFDKYFRPDVNPINEESLNKREFQLVLSTAVFEHVRARTTLDEIESYVENSGCLAIHTLVPESVPRDPDWMYLLPVHCAFHTNASMQILMEQWGYTCSVYNEYSKMWVLFRGQPTSIRRDVDKLNRSLGWTYLRFKQGFMDYWK